MKEFIQAPLPFQGQKRNFLKQFKECLNEFKDKTTFIDLFGGSGLLAHTIKQQRPDARVIFNDYDWFVTRLENIPTTNKLLTEIRNECIGLKGRGKEAITGERKQRIVEIITKYEQQGYVDYITLSASLLFSGKYVTTYNELIRMQFYNKVKMVDYDASNYLQGVEIEHLDYKLLFNLYKHLPNVCFVLDPPYLSTDCSSYKSTWRLKDYLDVLLTLQGTSYFYFTSNKTSIVELCQWLAMHPNLENPLRDAQLREVTVSVNKDSKYRDMMFYRNR
ncbi:MAG: DNA adenine methylase [Bacteroidales bacterium]|nr:DNA adenine methylase [Bacteroidales bacterium]